MILAFSLACTHWYPLVFRGSTPMKTIFLISNLQITSWRAGTRSRHCSCGWDRWNSGPSCKMINDGCILCCAFFCSVVLCYVLYVFCMLCSALLFFSILWRMDSEKNVSIHQQWIFHHWNLYWILTPHGWVLVLTVLTCLNCLNQNNFFLGRGQVSENLLLVRPQRVWDVNGYHVRLKHVAICCKNWQRP